ncbi:MAG TPA: amidohydrolase family protein [Streptosporangiaceae bacterium]|nr:amidohydrolase family protein [Streptosporangiaceae bacterium]
MFGSDGTFRTADVLIEQDSISEVGASLAVPESAQVVELAGSAVLPGLIDVHTHLTHGYAGVVEDREAGQGVRSGFQALRALRAGLTTVRELGSYRQADIALRDAIRAGRTLGPRMLCAGTYLTITGGHGHPKGRAADGPAEVRRAVREQFLAGADLIKVMCSGGAAREDESPDASQFTPEEIDAIVDEAGLAGRPVAAHAHPARSIKWALQAGAYSIEHGTFLDDECCDLLAERRAFLVPTLNVYKTLAQSTQWPHLRERAAFLYERKLGTFRRGVQRGVTWAVGSDTSMFLPIEDFHKELTAISEALELEPAAVLQAATKGNAALLGLDRLGEIAPGYLADLIVVADGDPTRDLAAVRNVRYTIAAGRLIDWAAFENAMGPRWYERNGGGA